MVVTDGKQFEVGESLGRGFPSSQERQKEGRFNAYSKDLNKKGHVKENLAAQQ